MTPQPAASQARAPSPAPEGKRLTRWYLLREVLLPLLMGAIAAWLIIGWDGLDPSNIGWNSQGDASTHYLGWWFFRNSPWHFPLGKNPDYGLEIGSAIFYSDSIPLLAFLFKPFAAWLSTPFQYFGIWVALSLMLQALFAWRVLGSFPETESVALRLSAVGLFVFSPPLMIRIGGHSALAGHWLIVAALFLYARPGPRARRYAWPALVLTASLVHSYLFVMVLALWFADLLRRLLQRAVLAVALDSALVAAAGVLGLWQAGFFLVRIAPQGGYGRFGMNLLAPVNPDLYSRVIPALAPPFTGFHEGYNFAGLGSLLLIPALIVAVVLRRHGLLRGLQQHLPLLAILLALTLFAVSHQIGIGTLELHLPLPKGMLDAASTLRSSGRMFWPVHYALLTALVLLIARGYGQRLACLLLVLATSVQVFDSSRGWWNHLHAHFHGRRATSWPTRLQAPFWEAAGKEYKILRRVPSMNAGKDYAMFAYLAASHHMATNAAYLARVDASALDRAAEADEQALTSGAFDPETLYVLDTAHAALAAQLLDPAADLLTRVDGYFVLAPGWQRGEHAAFVTPGSVALHDFQPELAAGVEVSFDDGGAGVAYLGRGWSQPEAWGVWSEGPRAELSLPIDAHSGGALSLALRVAAFVPLSPAKQTVECWINGFSAGVWSFLPGEEARWREVAVPPPALEVARKTEQLSVRFEIATPASPEAQGEGQDRRALGLALHRLRLSSSR